MFTFSSCNIESLDEEEQATATDNFEEYISNAMDTPLSFTKHLSRLQKTLLSHTSKSH